MKNDYYVYEHIRNDNGSCFYVGKGIGRRAWTKSRNEHHDRISEKVGMTVKIVQDNLSQQEAYDLERKTIENYVFNLNYGINVDGYRNYDGFYLTNMNFGGEGNYGVTHTEAWRKEHSIKMTGENNPMFGINVWDSYDDEKKLYIKSIISEHSSGMNNPMYGISPKNRMTDDKYQEWYSKTSKRCSEQTGENNPNYGNDTLHNKLKDNPELRIKYYSRPGTQNGSASGISIFKDNMFIRDFELIKDCANWIKETLRLTSKMSTIQSSISTSMQLNKPYRGYTFIKHK